MWKIPSILALAVLSGCFASQKDETLPNDGTEDTQNGDTEDTQDGDTEDTQDGDTEDTQNDECSDYRSSYPAGSYGTTVGSVIEDVPGMVDGDGNARSFAEIYADTTKVALVIANAFDT